MNKHYMSRGSSRTARTLWMCMFLAFACFVSIATVAKAGESYLSPSAMVADNQSKTLYIAQATAKQVAVFDIAAGKVIRTYSLSGRPSGLALAADSSRLYVTCSWPQ